MSSREPLAGLFDALPDALILVDAEGRIVRANGSAERLFGYPPDALAGLEVEALVPAPARGRHRTHRERYTEQAHVRPMGAAGQSLLGLRRDGAVFPVEIALSPLASEAGTHYLASVRDISGTQRERQATARMRYDAVVARLGQMALEAPGEAALIEALPGALSEALGVESVAIVLVVRSGPAAEVRAAVGGLWAVGDLVAHGLDPYPLPSAPVVVDGARPTPQRAAFPLPLGSEPAAALMPLLDCGRVTGAVTAAASTAGRFDHDALHLLQSVANLLSAFLQQRRTEEQLAHSQRLEALGQLTGGIAHDFNNLLTVVSGSLQLLEPECTSADARDLVASAQRCVARGGQLTASLLAYARRQRLMPQAVDVHALLLDLVVMLQRTLGERISLQVLCDEALPAAYADPAQLEAALLNLALNARDAMFEGGTITLRADEALVGAWQAHAGLPIGEYVRITVADQGRGMSPDTLARAVEPFFTTKEAGRGSGLGLSRIYGFARQSHGGLHIDSALGRGTSVALYLPLAGRAAAPSQPAAAPRPRRRGERILVVEDHAGVSAIAVTFLRDSGYQVLSAATGEEALQVLRQDPGVSLLFSDVMLGVGLRGDELGRLAQAESPALAVLLTSGHEDPVEANGSRFELLPKPYRREDLVGTVDRLLGSRAGAPATPLASTSRGDAMPHAPPASAC